MLLALVLVVPACELPPPDPNCTVAAIGDSLLVGTAPQLGGELAKHGCTLQWWDAMKSRRTFEGVDVLTARMDQLPAVIVVSLGTNDRYDLANFVAHVERVMALARGRQVVWTETAYPPVRDHVNGVLRQAADRYPNLVVMPWDRPYWDNPTWRGSDDVHCTKEGYRLRGALTAAWVRAAVDGTARIPK
jgi:lysophospholipase L1-like esterase